jgi:Holliday junction resolvase RusA-like endonuclease
MEAITFTVIGKPRPRGSKQANVRYGRDGKPVTKSGRVLTFVKDDNEPSKEWMGQVRDAAHDAYSGQLITGPVRVTARFYFKRPASHYRSNNREKPLKADAPQWCAGVYDTDKLQRAIGDSLSGVVLVDDKQIAIWDAAKAYTAETECAEIWIEPLS